MLSATPRHLISIHDLAAAEVQRLLSEPESCLILEDAHRRLITAG